MISGRVLTCSDHRAPGAVRPQLEFVSKPRFQVPKMQNPRFGFRFLRGLTASVKAPEYGPQCPFDWVEVCCIAICVYIVGIIEINAHDNVA